MSSSAHKEETGMPRGIDPEILAKYTGDVPSDKNVYNPWDIDYIHATKKVRCVRETADYLYGSFTRKRIRRPGLFSAT
jgi:hypothetical protein